MQKKTFVLVLAGSLGMSGILGLGVITIAQSLATKGGEDKELTQAKEMLRKTFEKNKELEAEVQKLTERHVEVLKQVEEKEKEKNEQVDLLKKLTQEREEAEKLRKDALKNIEQQPPAAAIQTQQAPVSNKPAPIRPAASSIVQPVQIPDKQPQVNPVKSSSALPPAASSSNLSAPASTASQTRVQPEPSETPSRSLITGEKDITAVMLSPSMPRNALLEEIKAKERELNAVNERTKKQIDVINQLAQGIPVPEEAMAPLTSDSSAPVVPIPEYIPMKSTADLPPLPAAQAVPSPSLASELDTLSAMASDQTKKRRSDKIKNEDAKTPPEDSIFTTPTALTPDSDASGLPAPLEVKHLEARSQQLEEELKKSKETKDKDRVTFMYNLGFAYTEAGLYEDAASMYEKALALDPNDASSHYNLGILYDEHLDDLPKAIEHYRAFLRLSKDTEKRRQVEGWIRIAKKNKFSSTTGGRTRSAKRAFEHLVMPGAGG